ncbi:MAG: hypothetical protein ACK51T_02795, partial [bacterium]
MALALGHITVGKARRWRDKRPSTIAAGACVRADVDVVEQLGLDSRGRGIEVEGAVGASAFLQAGWDAGGARVAVLAHRLDDHDDARKPH